MALDVNAWLNSEVAKILAADAVTDDAALAAAQAAFNVKLAASAAELATVKKQLADCVAGNPPPPPPPPPDPDPDPDPTPTPTGYPDESNTGVPAGTVLTAYTGTSTVAAGTTIEAKTITKFLRCGSNVTIRKCKIDSSASFIIDADGASGLVVEDCTITGKGLAGQNAAILGGRDAKVRRCNISKLENGIVLQNGANLVEGNYIHDLQAGPDGHYDCISVQGGQNGTIVRHNTLLGYDTAAVFIKCDFGAIVNTLVEDNLVKNQPGKRFSYPMYSVKGNSGQTPTGTRFINNRIEKGTWGYFSTEGSVVRQGNVDAVSGANVDSK